jgi:hypothetical protein
MRRRRRAGAWRSGGGRPRAAAWLVALGLAALAGRNVLAEPPAQDCQSADDDVADGEKLWLPVRSVDAADPPSIRAAPTVRSTVVGWIPQDACVLATGPRQAVGRSTWWPVAYLDLRGWVDGKFLADSNQPPEREGGWLPIHGVESGDTLNIRAAPGPHSTLLGRIPPDARVRATGRSKRVGPSTWREVTFLRVRGWVNGKFLGEESRDPRSMTNR